ncbi:hypothetical protein JTB14_025042 [Gonioctena quinquepunctata]|nr:hypothetical protein JTB14_025042 [Gonioctena quinquepunctata]
MVQNELYNAGSKKPYDNKSIISNKIYGFENNKKSFGTKENKQTKYETKKENAAWGSTFKNKDHFASLHHC